MSPRSKAQLQEIREQSKEKILGAALELFAQQGFHKTTISQIASKAKVAKGLIYNYFESKEELLQGIIDSALAEGSIMLEQMSQLQKPEEKLAFIIQQSFSYMKERRDYMKLITGLSLQIDQFPSLHDMVQNKYTEGIPFCASLLSEINWPDPENEARIMSALLDGILLQYLVVGEIINLELLENSLLDKYNLTPYKP